MCICLCPEFDCPEVTLDIKIQWLIKASCTDVKLARQQQHPSPPPPPSPKPHPTPFPPNKKKSSKQSKIFLQLIRI